MAPLPAQSVMPAPAAVPTDDDAPEVAAAIAVLAERAAQLHHGGGAGLLDCFAAIADPLRMTTPFGPTVMV